MMDIICKYAFDKAIFSSDYDIIEECLKQNVEYEIVDMQIKMYIEELLINNNMKNFCDDYDQGMLTFLSHTKSMRDKLKLNYYGGVIVNFIEKDEYVISDDQNEIDEPKKNIIIQMIKLTKDNVSLETLLYIQQIMDVVHMVFELNKYGDDCIPYLLEYMIFDNNVDNVNMLVSKMENPNEIIKNVIIDNLRKKDYTYLHFIVDNNIYNSKDIFIEILKFGLKVFDKYVIMYCVNKLDKDDYHNIIVENVLRFVEKINYLPILFLFDMGIFCYDDFDRCDNMIMLYNRYVYGNNKIEKYNIKEYNFECVINNIFVKNYNEELNLCDNLDNVCNDYGEMMNNNWINLKNYSYKVRMLIQYFRVFDIDINKIIGYYFDHIIVNIREYCVIKNYDDH